MIAPPRAVGNRRNRDLKRRPEYVDRMIFRATMEISELAHTGQKTEGKNACAEVSVKGMDQSEAAFRGNVKPIPCRPARELNLHHFL